MAEEIQNAVLLSTFRIGKKRYRVYFHRSTIIWDREKPPHAQHTLPIENVISVQYNYVSEDSEPANPKCFTIHYAERGKKQTWEYNYVTFEHSDPMQLCSWVKTLQNHLQSFTQRPKRLLLFVNPYGGKKKALKIFDKYCKTFFRLAGVDVSVLVSQRPNQIRDIVMAPHSLDLFDSVACVGGDGTFSELYNGMVLRECKEQGLDPHDIDVELPKPRLPLGVIPGGSTDTIAYCIHGTDDVATAVLNIVFGDKLGLDLVSVHNDTHFMRLYASILSYGFLGEVAHDAEQYRWMGPARYEYVGFKKLVGNAGYEGEITVVSEKVEGDQSEKCFAQCVRCTGKKTAQEDGSSKAETVSNVISGKFFNVGGANITCACSRSPNGVAPYSHLGDGSVQLVLVRHTSIINNIRLLLRLGSTKSAVTVEGLPFVETHRAQEFNFRGIGPKYSKWNCDGELETDTCLRAKVRCQLINVFSRGRPKPEEDVENARCCRLS